MNDLERPQDAELHLAATLPAPLRGRYGRDTRSAEIRCSSINTKEGAVRISKAVAVAAALGAMAVAASSAQATVVEHVRTIEPLSYGYDCGFPVAVSGSMKDLFVL